MPSHRKWWKCFSSREGVQKWVSTYIYTREIPTLEFLKIHPRHHEHLRFIHPVCTLHVQPPLNPISVSAQTRSYKESQSRVIKMER